MSDRPATDWLDRAGMLPEVERAKHLANPELPPSTVTDPLVARAIERWWVAAKGLERVRDVVAGSFFGSQEERLAAERELRIACGRVEAAGAELCVVAASLGEKR